MTHTTRPDDQVRRMLEQTLMPSPHVIELDPDPLSAVTSRFATANGTVAEQAHLASVITENNASRMMSDSNTASLIRQWYFDTGADGVEELIRLGSKQVRELSTLDDPLAACLSPYREMGPPVAPLFVADVVVTTGASLWKVVPGTGHATFEGRFDDEDAVTVATSLEAWPPGIDPVSCTFVFLVGAFARAGHLSSGRAHRSSLVQSGRIAGTIETNWAARQRPNEIFLTTDAFLDRRIDAVLRNDGVERATVAAIAICPLETNRPTGDDHDSDD